MPQLLAWNIGVTGSTTSLFFKSHMALERRHLTTGDGLVVSGIHGTLSALARLIRTEQPEGLAVMTDTAAPTFRHRLYPHGRRHRVAVGAGVRLVEQAHDREVHVEGPS